MRRTSLPAVNQGQLWLIFRRQPKHSAFSIPRIRPPRNLHDWRKPRLQRRWFAMCMKYGVTRDYVSALSGYLANGKAVRWGRDTRKFATGYNMRDLWIGSEGTLESSPQPLSVWSPSPRGLRLFWQLLKKMVRLCRSFRPLQNGYSTLHFGIYGQLDH